MDEFFTHSFSSEIDEYGVGKSRKVWYRVLFLPPELEPELPFDEYPRLRVDAEIEDIPLSGAWNPTGDGRRYIILSPETLKSAGLAVGDNARLRFRVADQDQVDVPEALASALEELPEAKKVWDGITAGKKRALAYFVSGAKKEATIRKRVSDAIEALTERDGQIRKPKT